MITHPESLKTFYTQLEYVLENYQPHGLQVANYNNIVIAGLGGSGIGGKLTKSYFAGKTPIPVDTVSDYVLPAYVNNKTLLILCSYSGNTEETLSVFDAGKALGCTMLAVTAGGKLMELVKSHNIKYNTIAGGFQPRMALGYSFGFLLKMFAELLGEEIDADFAECIENLQHQDEHQDAAMGIMKKFGKYLNSKYVIVADGPLEAAAIRACQQLQENAKKEAFCNVLPEANHNVIESYYGQLDANFILLNSNSHERVGERFEFVNGLLEKENNRVVHIMVEELSLRMIFSIIHKLDWLSIFIAEETGANPMEIENIISLKDFLADQEPSN
jgi:glucose/mannose-6-phosphate isomerase